MKKFSLFVSARANPNNCFKCLKNRANAAFSSLETPKDSSRHGNYVTVGSYKDFVYLENSINSTNTLSLETKRRSTFANRCYY